MGLLASCTCLFLSCSGWAIRMLCVAPSVICDKGLVQTEKLLPVNPCPGEHPPQFLLSQQSDRTGQFYSFSPIRGFRVPPHVEMADQEHSEAERKKLEKWKEEVRLNREETIWRLNEISMPDSRDLSCHPDLVFASAYVLDNRVGENNIELVVSELSHISGI